MVELSRYNVREIVWEWFSLLFFTLEMHNKLVPK